jgi:hypothetical protein
MCSPWKSPSTLGAIDEFISSVLIPTLDADEVWRDQEHLLTSSSTLDIQLLNSDVSLMYYGICAEAALDDWQEPPTQFLSASAETINLMNTGQDGAPWESGSTQCRCLFGWSGDYCTRKECPTKEYFDQMPTVVSSPVIRTHIEECVVNDGIRGHCELAKRNPETAFSFQCKCDGGYGPGGPPPFDLDKTDGTQKSVCPWNYPVLDGGTCVVEQSGTFYASGVNPIHQWALETNGADSGDPRVDLTLVGDASFLAGGGAQLDGTGDYLNLGSFTFAATAGFTWCAWVRYDAQEEDIGALLFLSDDTDNSIKLYSR